MKEELKEVENFIMNNHLKKAVELIISITEQIEEEELHNEGILILSRINNLVVLEGSMI